MGSLVCFLITLTTSFIPNGITNSKPILYAPIPLTEQVDLTSLSSFSRLSTSQLGIIDFFSLISVILNRQSINKSRKQYCQQYIQSPVVFAELLQIHTATHPSGFFFQSIMWLSSSLAMYFFATAVFIRFVKLVNVCNLTFELSKLFPDFSSS